MPKFHARVNTARAEKRLIAVADDAARETVALTNRLANDAVFVFQSVAPRGPSGELGRGIRVFTDQSRSRVSGRFESGQNYAVIAAAHNPATGYDYVGVTRFGTWAKRIYPLVGKALQPRGLTKDHPKRGTIKLFWDHTRGVTVTRDWAQLGVAAVNREVEAESAALARRIELRWR